MMVVVLVMRLISISAESVALVTDGRGLTSLDTTRDTARFDAAPTRLLRHDGGRERRSESKNEGGSDLDSETTEILVGPGPFSPSAL